MNDYPDVSILLPVYKRHEFLTLTLYNIKTQEYPHSKLTLIIDECKSDEPFIRDITEYNTICEYLKPINVIHNCYNQRKTIGEKRNRLIKSSRSQYCQFFDSDDLYKPTAISYNYNLLKDRGVKCVGSDKMIFCYTEDNFQMSGINCGNRIGLIHEATMFFNRKWFVSTNKFARSSRGEGGRFFEGLTEKQVAISDIKKVMICLVHQKNTVKKDKFKKDLVPMNDDLIVFLRSILGRPNQ